jgi:hypothetical protein
MLPEWLWARLANARVREIANRIPACLSPDSRGNCRLLNKYVDEGAKRRVQSRKHALQIEYPAFAD